MPRTLHGRLFFSYSALALVSVALAVGASIALFARGFEQRAHRDMEAFAQRSAEALADEDAVRLLREPGAPWDGALLAGVDAVPLLRLPRGPFGQAVLADAEGRVLERQQLPGAHDYAGAVFPPPAADDEPRVRETRLPDGGGAVYVAVPLPPRLAPRRDDGGPAYLVLVRRTQEVRGLWRPLVGPVVAVSAVALALASLIALALARTITRPLEEMTRASERMAAGDYGVQVAGADTDEIGRLAAAFNAMARQVAEAHRRQRELVANVGHDLRTPLTAIRGFAGALLDETAASPAQKRRAAEEIEGAAERMEALVGSLLELARLEGQQAGLELRSLDAAALLADVAAGHRHAAEAAGVRVAVEAEAGLRVRGDALWLGRALGNVLDNAIRHSRPGGTVRLLAAPAGPSHVTLVVEDEGEGIAPEVLPRVFERFYRGDASRGRGSSGLGLSIAREIVAAHGGQIAIASAPRAGTRVSLRLGRA